MFFEQIVGSPANAFVLIITVVVGFVAGMSFIDSNKQAEENKKNRPF